MPLAKDCAIPLFWLGRDRVMVALVCGLKGSEMPTTRE